MTFGKKLFISFALLAMMLGLGYSSWSFGGPIKDTHSGIDQAARSADLIGSIETAIAGMKTAQRGLVIATFFRNPDEARQHDADFRRAAAQVEKLLADSRPLIATETGRAAAERIQSALADWIPAYEDLALACAAGQRQTMEAALDRAVAPAIQIQTSAAQIIQIQRAFMAKAAIDAGEVSGPTRGTALVVLGLSAAIGLVVLFIVKASTGPLRNVVAELTVGAEQLSSNSEAPIREQTSDRQTKSSISAEKTMAEAEPRIEQANATPAQQMPAQKIMASTTEIDSSGDGVAKDGVVKDEVAQIDNVIDEIAFQTDILALNAAVAAACVGEAARGFAVTAEEVRNLAQGGAPAALNTAGLRRASKAGSLVDEGTTVGEEVAVSGQKTNV